MSEQIYGPHPDPRFALEEIANELMDVYERLVEERGGEHDRIFIALRANGFGTPNALAAGRGFENAEDVFAFLLVQAMKVGEQLGRKVLVAPIGRG